MLALTWFTSVAVSLPIAVGMNYTDRRSQTPNLCTFYNADFLIYSSMTSFYIPCVVILLLYWRIFRAIHSRTRRRTAAATSGHRLHRQLPDIYVVDNHVNAVATSVAGERPEAEVEGSVGVWVGEDGGVTGATEGDAGGAADCVLSLSSGHDSSTSRALKTEVPGTSTTQSAEKKRRSAAEKKSTTLASRLANDGHLQLSRLTRLSARPATKHSMTDSTSVCQSRDKNASRRERKATKTLAIVLGTTLQAH